MTVYVADTYAQVQRQVSLVKMATVLEACTIKEQRHFVRFLWAKRFTGKDIHKEMFSDYGGKCFSHKAVQNWLQTFC
jgi:hypothetical protein